MVKQRVSDRAFLNLIGKWLRAGIMEEDGQVVHPAKVLRKEKLSVVCLPIYIFEYYSLPWPKVIWQVWSGQQELDFA